MREQCTRPFLSYLEVIVFSETDLANASRDFTPFITTVGSCYCLANRRI